MKELNYNNSIEKWDIFEVSCKGFTGNNPFVDYKIEGVFRSKNEEKIIEGFYDGDGNYKVRFMPSFEGKYYFTIKGNFSDKTYCGEFNVIPASLNNHGPMRVQNTFHFAYEDGTPYYSIGTTCYVWHLQNEETQKQTLKTLKNSAFNKIRFCIFPKHYDYNLNEPILYPYEGTPMDSSVLTTENFMEYTGKTKGNNWNFEKFNVKYFKHIESCIEKLRDLNIEADLIIMHPYDRWGFSQMSEDQDDLYINYIIARFSAYRNVWWSVANEYDLMPQKSIKDWERYAKLFCEKDPYNHLRSIHNCRPFYDYSRPWITHASIQRQDVYKTAEFVTEWRERYRKPIVIDEIAYEGNIQFGWGNISGKELVRRYWEATVRGGYVGHGETYLNEDNILWWSHGGVLHGESPARLKFLESIFKELPNLGLLPIQGQWDEICATYDSAEVLFEKVHKYYLYYYGFNRPSFREFYYDDTTNFQVEVIDTWNMTIDNVGIYNGKFKIKLPGREYMAIRIKRISEN